MVQVHPCGLMINDQTEFTYSDVMLYELGARVVYAMFFENTGTDYNRLNAINSRTQYGC